MQWTSIPLGPVAMAFAAGIALAPFAPGAAAWAAWGAALGITIVAVALGRLASAAIPLLVAVAALGALRAMPGPLARDHLANLSLPRSSLVEGRLVEEPRRWADDRTRVLLDVGRVDGASRSGLIQLTLYGPAPPLAEGHRIRVPARLYRPSGFRNPGGFDYAVHLAREDIHVVGSAPADRVTVLDAPAPPWAARVRRRAVAAIENVLPPASAALLAGLLLGDRGRLPVAIDESFRRAGVYHVLAVSGFNVALIASAAWALLRLGGIGHRVAAAVVIVVVVGFGLVVGFQPSVLRAVIMAGLVLAALVLEREASVVNSLALAGLAILAFRLGDLLDPGFQLSFAATGGIVLAPTPRSVLGRTVGISLAAQLTVVPIGLSHFNQLSTIGPMANLVVVPLAGLATVIGLLAVVVEWVSETMAAAMLNGVWPVLIALRAAVWAAARVPGALVYLPAPSAPAIVCYVGALAGGLAWWHTRGVHPFSARRIGAAALALGGVAAGLAAWPVLRPPDGRLHVSILDVGQGDAIVVRAPDGAALVVDAGSGGLYRLDAGERVVAPFLWNQGALRLTATLVTHRDLDHAGGMGALHRRFSVGEVWDRATFERGPRWLGGVMISLLDPLAGAASATAGLPRLGVRPVTPSNAASIVLRLEFGLATLLLASDIGAAQEEALVTGGVPVGATVLKVAHHGSGGSSSASFLRVVQPVVAIVSVGVRNSYRHPHPATLARLEAVGARTYRTDRDGAILLETDGRVLTVTPTVGGQVDRYCLDPETLC